MGSRSLEEHVAFAASSGDGFRRRLDGEVSWQDCGNSVECTQRQLVSLKVKPIAYVFTSTFTSLKLTKLNIVGSSRLEGGLREDE
jgi:hypothetical protein